MRFLEQTGCGMMGSEYYRTASTLLLSDIAVAVSRFVNADLEGK